MTAGGAPGTAVMLPGAKPSVWGRRLRKAVRFRFRCTFLAMGVSLRSAGSSDVAILAMSSSSHGSRLSLWRETSASPRLRGCLYSRRIGCR